MAQNQERKSKTEEEKKTKNSSGNSETKEKKSKDKKDEKSSVNFDLDKIKDLINLITSEKDLNKLRHFFYSHINKIIKRHEISKDYLILFLYDENNSINEKMTDKIYAAIPENNDKPILLILQSIGGQIEPAYLISKTCKEKSSKFSVVVPRRAKSAATLISLGADEIHMGSMSELGPIDPQFGKLPALGLSSSLESIARVVSDYPKSSEMFAKYLGAQLDLRVLGYFERVSESAKQYAHRLLEGKKTPKNISEISYALVYEYKDHNFVIDKEEAKNHLGDIIKTNTKEYQLANDIHKFMSDLNWLAGIVRKKNLEIVGNYANFGITDIS